MGSDINNIMGVMRMVRMVFGMPIMQRHARRIPAKS